MIRGIWLSLFGLFTVYTTIVYFKSDNSIEGNNANIVAGMNTWQEKNCQSCHQLYGLGGYMGPDLTNVASATGKGPAYMHGFIKYGTGKMPNLNLTDTEIENIIAFLSWVDKSGKSKVPASAVHWTGTYILPK